MESDEAAAPVVSPMIVDLHTDVADLEAKENRLDDLIATCQQDFEKITQPVSKYPLLSMRKLFLPFYSCVSPVVLYLIGTEI